MGVFRKKLDMVQGDGIGDKKPGNSGGFNRMFNEKMKLPFYKIIAGANGFNILPFEVTSKHNHLVYTNKVKVGDGAYVLPVYVHKNVGDQRLTVVCPRETWGGKCPICEARWEAYHRYKDNHNESDKEYSNSLRPKLRCLYNVAVVGGDNDGEVMVFDVSNFKFHTPLLEYASEPVNDEDDSRFNMKRVGGIIDFPDVDEGYTVKFSGKAATFNGKEFFEPSGIRLTKRKEPISEAQLEKVLSLDECINELSYDELLEVFESAPNGGNDAKEVKEEPNDDYNKVPWAGDDKEESKEESEECVGCPFKHKFGEDYDSTNDCDTCMDEETVTYKKCRKANADM